MFRIVADRLGDPAAIVMIPKLLEKAAVPPPTVNWCGEQASASRTGERISFLSTTGPVLAGLIDMPERGDAWVAGLRARLPVG